MCYFIVLMSSPLVYNVENSKNKEKPWNEMVCPNFCLVHTYVHIHTHTVQNIKNTFLILSYIPFFTQNSLNLSAPKLEGVESIP
jgi:hypothetical protein